MRSSAAPKRARTIRVLASHRVDDEQALVGFHGAASYLLHLFHEFGVDVQAARGVDDEDVVDALARSIERVSRVSRRLLLAVGREKPGADLFRQSLQLQNGRRTADVRAD